MADEAWDPDAAPHRLLVLERRGRNVVKDEDAQRPPADEETPTPPKG